MTATTPTVEALRAALAERLTPEGAAWLEGALRRVQADPGAVGGLFPAAGRRCGRGPLDPAAGARFGWTVDDAARALLLAALPLTGAALAEEVAAAYRHGDAAERRGVLRALHLLDLGDAGVPLVTDAIRSNDTRLIAAALGPYAADHLPPAWYRQAILKCVFVGIPLAEVAGLDRRADAELARMLLDFAHERVAAGRDVPGDVWPLIERHPELLATHPILAELTAAVPERRAAAARALAGRVPTTTTGEG